MCGRYSIFRAIDTDDLEDRFGATPDSDLEPRYNAAPSQDLPVITSERPDTVARLRWGLIPSWADDPGIGNDLINARAETVAEKPAFREAYQGQRCLVLADGFYEWAATDGGTQPYRVTRADEEPFAMAGLWERWTPTETQTALGSFTDDGDGNDDGDHDADDSDSNQDGGAATDPDAIETFTIITTEPNGVVAPLHDRMPVVLDRDEEGRWLREDSGEVADLLDPYPAERTRAYPVSTAVNDPTNDSPELVDEVETGA